MADVKNLNEFYSILRSEGAKLSHQFQMHIILEGEGLPANVGKAFEDVTMWAEGSQLPGRTLKNAQLSYMGYELSVPTVADMTKELELTLKCDAGMNMHKAALQWHASYSRLNNGSELGNGGGNKSISNARIELRLLANDMQTVERTYVLVGAYPTAVGDIALTNADPEVINFSLGLTFQYWYIDGEDTTGGVSTAGI
jgi:hypothetical protein